MTEQSTVTLTTATPVTLPDAQTVTAVEQYTDRLLRFRVTRPASLRFRSGEFVMIGLMGDPDPVTGKQKPLLRAYSIASPAWDETLQFYSIKVADGPLTSKLQHIKPGDQVILRPKPVGTLVMTPSPRPSAFGFSRPALGLPLSPHFSASRRPMNGSKR